MATPSQIEANKANALKSTGPRTDAGKLLSRDNALKHALASRHLILEEEDPADYESLRADLLDHYQPQDPPEALLLDQFAQSAWRLQRVRRLETATFSKEFVDLHAWTEQSPMADATLPDVDQQRALIFHTRAKEFDNLRRHESAIERAYYRSYRELEKIRKERLKASPPVASKETANPEIGSVLQNPIPPAPAASATQTAPHEIQSASQSIYSQAASSPSITVDTRDTRSSPSGN